MCKSKVQPLIPFISRRGQIIHLLIFTHSIPFPVPLPIPFHVVHLGAQVQEDVEHYEEEQDLVSTFVSRGIIFLVDVGGDDAGCLNAHVVQSCRDGARTDGVGVAGVPAYLDWVG
jgi:hypothetical protein